MDQEDARSDIGGCMRLGCLFALALLICLPLGYCQLVEWRQPRQALPPEVQSSEIIAFDSESALREGCAFGVYRITPDTAARFMRGDRLPAEWSRTPLEIEDDQYVHVGPERRRVTLYANHASTCASDKVRRLGLNDYRAVLGQPGNWYKIFNGGEGMILVAPGERLAWYMYVG